MAVVLAASAARADCPDAPPRLAKLLRDRRFADAHHAATAVKVLCGPSDDVRLVDDIALLRLEDRDYALHDLDSLGTPAAEIILAWAYVTDHETQAAHAMLARIPPSRAAAIEALAHLDDRSDFAFRVRDPSVLAIHSQYIAARRKSPALAGVLTAILPGAGQIYAGSASAAAITFVLNGLFIGATAEQAAGKHYATAAAAGVAASFFYVGGIMNAVDLARRENRLAQQSYADALEELIVPELDGASR